MTTSRVGTLAMIEKSATSRTWSRPLPPISERIARRMASRRAIITIKAMAGTKPQSFGNADPRAGRAYNTGVYALVLQLDGGRLKFLGQRQE